jgi:23S rRNA pseudouridine2605 synthase
MYGNGQPFIHLKSYIPRIDNMAKPRNPKKKNAPKFFESVKKTSNPKLKPLKPVEKETPVRFSKKNEEGLENEKTKIPRINPSAKKNFSSKDRVKTKPPKYDPKKIKQAAHEKGVPEKPADADIRLNKFISNSGICSRREADQLIQAGRIEVNGKIVTEMGYKVNPSDNVKCDGKQLQGEQFVYVLLNKPKNVLSTTKDDFGRKTVMDLVGNACKERIYPVGRLDKETVGLLLFTNDGELATRLTHPSNNIRKVYRVELDRPMAAEDFSTLGNGIELEDGPIKPDELAMNQIDKTVVGIEIHSGRNRIVRRMFEHFGYTINKLDRTAIAGLTKKDLPRGRWRYLTEAELIKIKFMGHNK